MNHRIGFLSLCICIILLSSCAKYRAQSLNNLTTFTSNKKEPVITFAYKALNKAECKKYLDRDVLVKGYQPVHLTISNNTNRYLNFSQTNISLECIPVSEVARKVHTSTAGRIASYGVASLIMWPFAIPAVVDGVKSSKANKKLNEDFSNKELQDQIISPFHTINGLIFVSAGAFNQDFSITLIDSENRERFTLSTSKPVLKV